MAFCCVPPMPTMASTRRLFPVVQFRMHTSSGRNSGSSPWGRYGGAGDQPVAFQLFRRRAVQERRKGCGTAYNDRCAGKGVRQIVAGVCQSVQYQLAAAQPEKDLKAVVRVPVPAAEQGADMEQRICGGSE